MKLRLILANHAEVQNSLLYVAGAGWTEIGPGPSVFAICALVDVPWEETNRKHRLEIAIVDADEKPVMVETATGREPLTLKADFEVGRPAGAPAGRWFTVPVAANLAQVLFEPDRAYVVRGEINGARLDEVRFLTRPLEKARPTGQRAFPFLPPFP